MTAIQVSTHGDAARLGAAAIPVPVKGFAEWASWGRIHGEPGTMDIAAPAPVPGLDSQGVALAIQGAGSGGMGLPSSVTPWWRPAIYYQRTPPAGPSTASMAIESDNQMPVPAIPANLNARQAMLARKAAFLGNRSVRWPVVLPSFADRIKGGS